MFLKSQVSPQSCKTYEVCFAKNQVNDLVHITQWTKFFVWHAMTNELLVSTAPYQPDSNFVSNYSSATL